MSRTHPPSLRGDERGVALPLALVGLVAVTLLVSTALVTASTEFAVSSAHQAATESLYRAEGGLQAFVAAQGTTIHEIAGSGAIDFAPGGGAPVRITVVHLGDRQFADSTSVRVYAVRSASPRGGRSVAAQVTQVLAPPLPMQFNITAALTIGGHLEVGGSAFRVSGRSLDPACGAGGSAVRVSGESEVGAAAGGAMTNLLGVDGDGKDVDGEAAIDRSGMGGAELALDLLGGVGLEQLIASVPASHRWGRLFSPAGGTVRRFSGRMGQGEAVAVVDGEGGAVRVEGGSGVLIILDGDLEMGGEAHFDGVIVAAGSFRLGGRARVNGALIGLSGDVGDGSAAARQASIAGDASVQYDRCAVDAGSSAFDEIVRESLVPAVLPTYAWQEVVH